MKLEEPECEKRPVPRGTRKLRLRAGELCQEESECQEEPEGFEKEPESFEKEPESFARKSQSAKRSQRASLRRTRIMSPSSKDFASWPRPRPSYQARLRSSPRGKVHLSNTLTQHTV